MSDLLVRLRSAQQAFSPAVSGFHPPDLPSNYTPYACSYHWFRGPDGRVISLDLIRSDETGNLGLRVVRERADGGLDGLSQIAPKTDWQPFRTDGLYVETEAHGRPLISRSPHTIAGHCTAPSGAVRSVRFALDLTVNAPGFGTGQLGLGIAHLVATDYLDVHYRGFVEINGERLPIDSSGSLSLHSGDKLPQYAYLVAVPKLGGAPGAALLVAAVHGDALRIGGELLGGSSLTYGYGQHGVPPVSLHVGPFTHSPSLGLNGRIEIRDVHAFHHDLLGEPTCTASASARYVPLLGPAVELGRIFLDYRGQPFVDCLQSAVSPEVGGQP